MIGKTATLNLSSSFQSILENPENSNQIIEIVTFMVANIASTNAIVNIEVERAGTSYSLLKSGVIPANKSSNIFLSKDFGIYLEPGDSLKLKADEEYKLDATCSYYLINLPTSSSASSDSVSSSASSDSVSSSASSDPGSSSASGYP